MRYVTQSCYFCGLIKKYMSPFAIKAIQLLMSLSLLIVLHELGHFIPAKLFKTRVEKFFLFFDVKFALLKKKIGETEYGIGWLPLGGYVKISGMIDESMDKEQMAQPPKPWEFRSKPAWQRLIIMLGGVTVNVIVAFIIYAGILYFYGRDVVPAEKLPNGFAVSEVIKPYGFKDGDKVLKVNGKPLENVLDINRYLFLRDVETVTVQHADGNLETLKLPEDLGSQLFANDALRPFEPIRKAVIDSVIPDYPAGKVGLRKGDEIIAVNNKTVAYWHEFKKYVPKDSNAVVTITIRRGDQVGSFEIKPNEKGNIGVFNFSKELKDITVHNTYGFGESIVKGVSYGVDTLKDYISQMKYIFTKKGASQVGGFGAIGNMFPGAWDWLSFWETTAFISIVLAFMNVLPIPALDGGHVMFLLYEIVTGRKPNEKVMEYAQVAGFILLLTLVLLANGNDIYRWIFGS
jgi:regulator of sigma E protease